MPPLTFLLPAPAMQLLPQHLQLLAGHLLMADADPPQDVYLLPASDASCSKLQLPLLLLLLLLLRSCFPQLPAHPPSLSILSLSSTSPALCAPSCCAAAVLLLLLPACTTNAVQLPAAPEGVLILVIRQPDDPMAPHVVDDSC